MAETENIVVMRNIYKSFGAVQALINVDLTLRKGEILGLVGDNAAGKSTLMKILSGALLPDAGEIFFEGKKVTFSGPKDARRLGIEMIYQDFALCGNLSISDNVFLGRWETRPLLGGLVSVVDERKMREHAEGMMNLLKIDISSPRALAEALSGGQRQGVAIARAVGFNAKAIIMDEPTASISVKAISELLELTRHLKRQGISFVIISHRLQDIFAVADRVMVLKTGRCVSVKDVRETNLDETIQLIVRGKSDRD